MRKINFERVEQLRKILLEKKPPEARRVLGWSKQKLHYYIKRYNLSTGKPIDK